MRDEVRQFAEIMERELRLNDHKGGWLGCDESFLFSELDNHLLALKQTSIALSAGTAPREGDCDERDLLLARLLDDAADVANFAMMIADVWQALPEKHGEGEV